jgi:hypothetical protein
MNFKIIFKFTLAFFYFLAVSCKKDIGPRTPIAPGTVIGKIWPVTGVISITLDSLAEVSKYVGKINPDGTFNIPDVKPGLYQLRVLTAAVYVYPAGIDVNVKSSDTTMIPDINLIYDHSAQTGKIDFTLDGSDSYSVGADSVYLLYTSLNFQLSGITPATPNYYAIGINFQNITASGIYNKSNESFFVLSHYDSDGNILGTWTTEDGAGTLNITTLDISTRTASGTFNGTITPQGLPAGNSHIQISGVFNDVLY